MGDKDYLSSGPRTEITEAVRDYAEGIKKDSHLEFLYRSIIKINKDFRDIRDSNLLEKRTSSQIIEDKTLTGCSDYVHVLVPLARSNNIPSRVVRGIEKDSIPELKNKVEGRKRGKEDTPYRGHVVAECKVRDRWITVDPSERKIVLFPASHENSPFSRKYGGLIISKDSWEIGLRSFEDVKNYHEGYVREKYGLF